MGSFLDAHPCGDWTVEMRGFFYYATSLAILFTASCAHQKGAKLDPFVPVASDAKRSGVSLNELEEGLAHYRSHCGGCHMLYPSDSQPASKWPHWVQEMSERSHLSPDEAKRITAYLIALAGRPTTSLSSPPSH